MDKHHFEEVVGKKGSKLHLHVEVGTAVIHTHHEPSIIIDAETENMTISVSRSGDTVSVRVEHEDGWAETIKKWMKQQPVRSSLTVLVPPECEVQSRVITGKLEVRDVQAPVSARLTTGKALLSSLGGPVYAKAVTGNIRYTGNLVEDNHTFKVTTGNINLQFHDEPNARLSARATTGSIQCDLPLAKESQQRQWVGAKLKGVLGSGDGQIRASIVTGNVRLTSLAKAA